MVSAGRALGPEGNVATQVADWLDEERRGHALTKYAGGLAGNDIVRESIADGGPSQTAFDFLGNYLKRAQLFGLDTPQGRQALGKAIVTGIDFLEHAVALHGTMPAPGVPSGEIREWGQR